MSLDVAKIRMLFVAETSGATSAMEGLERRVQSFGDRVKQGLGFAAGALISIQALQAIDRAVDFVSDSIIGFNDRIDHLQIAFANMAGGGAPALAFMKDLQNFAIATPFEFDKLAQSAQILMARGIELGQVIPLLNAMGNAAAALGSRSDAIDRMTTALSQMNAKQRVQTQELNQLAETGVPALQILADAYGVSTAEVQKMVENGQVASGFFINAFAQWSQANFGTMMEQQAQTFSGSIARIKESLQFGISQGFRPFFDEVKSIIVDLANLLQGGWLTDITAVANVISTAAVSAMKAVEDSIKNNGIAGAFADLLNQIAAVGQDWFGAGWNLAVSFAEGLLQGANEYINAVVNEIASFIASFFVGQSPPPEGPLSEIDKGGYNTGAAWADGFADGIVEHIADPAEEVRKSFESITPNLDNVKGYLDQVNAKIDELDSKIGEIDDAIYEVNYKIQQTKQYYEDQIEPLQKQVDLLKNARDYATEMEGLQLKLRDIEIEKQSIAALGDPVLRAQLDGQLAALDIQGQLLDIQKNEEELKGKLANQDDVHRAEVEKLKVKRDQLIADEASLKAKLATAKTDEDRQRILADLAKNAEDQANNARDLKDKTSENLALQKQIWENQLAQLEAKKQLLEMVDQQGLAQATQAKEQNDAAIKQNDLTSQEFDLKNRILALPLEEKIAALKTAEEEALAPLQQQLDTLKQNKDELEHQKQQWTDLQKEIQQTQKDLEAAAKAAAGGAGGGKLGGAGGAGGGLGKGAGRVDVPLDIKKPDIGNFLPDPETVKARGHELAGKLMDGLVAFLKEHAGGLIGGALGAAIGGALFGPIGALIGGFIGHRLGDAIQKDLAKAGVGFDDIKRKITQTLTTLQEWHDRAMPYIRAFADWIVNHGIPDAQAFAQVLVRAWGPLWNNTLKPLVEEILRLGQHIADLIDKARNNEMVMRGLAIVWDGLTKILGGIIITIVELVNIFIDLIELDWSGLWNDIKTAFGGWKEIVAGAIEVLVGLGLIVDQWLEKLGQDLWNFVKDNWQTAWDAVVGVLDTAWGVIQTSAEAFWQHVLPGVLEAAWEALKGLLSTFWNETLPGMLQTAWDNIKASAEYYWGLIKDAIMGVIDQYVTDFQGQWDTLKSWLETAWDGIKSLAETVWGEIKDKIIEKVEGLYTDATEKVQNLWDDVKSKFGSLKDDVVNIAQGIWDDVKSKISSLKDDAVQLGQDLWDGVKGKVSGLKDDLVGSGANLIGGLRDEAISIFTDLKDKLVGGPGMIVNLITDGIKGLWNGLKEDLLGVGGSITSLVSGITDKAKEIYDNILGENGALATLVDDMRSLGGDAIQGFIDGISDIHFLETIKSVAQGIWDSLPGWLKKALDSNSPSIVMHRLGTGAMDGFINGLKEREDALTIEVRKFQKITQEIIDAAGQAVSAIGDMNTAIASAHPGTTVPGAPGIPGMEGGPGIPPLPPAWSGSEGSDWLPDGYGTVVGGQAGAGGGGFVTAYSKNPAVSWSADPLGMHPTSRGVPITHANRPIQVNVQVDGHTLAQATVAPSYSQDHAHNDAVPYVPV